jgi:enoyl-CoA hydratase/carnithine racemase
MSDPVALVIADDIALLTLNRPHKLNALNYEMIDRLMAHLDRIEVTPEVRAVILTGAGERAFSAGADIYEFSKSVSAGVNTAMRDFVRRGQAMTARLEAGKRVQPCGWTSVLGRILPSAPGIKRQDSPLGWRHEAISGRNPP